MTRFMNLVDSLTLEINLENNTGQGFGIQKSIKDHPLWIELEKEAKRFYPNQCLEDAIEKFGDVPTKMIWLYSEGLSIFCQALRSDLYFLNFFMGKEDFQSLLSCVDGDIETEKAVFANTLVLTAHRGFNSFKIAKECCIYGNWSFWNFSAKQFLHDATGLLNSARDGFNLKTFQLDENKYNLARSILLSKPALKIMQLLHSRIFSNDEILLRSTINRILETWKNGLKIFIVLRNTKQLFVMLSGVDERVYIDQSFEFSSDFLFAHALVHEVQHLFSRGMSLPYSPLELCAINEVKSFLCEYNDKIPMEAGHLFWAMMFNKVGVSEVDIESRDPQVSSCIYWDSLTDSIPIVPRDQLNDCEINENARVPYSLDQVTELTRLKDYPFYPRV